MTDSEKAEVEAFFPRVDDAMENGTVDVRTALANEIGMYEMTHADLEPWAVDQLDAAQDHLRNGLPTTESKKSPTLAAVKSWWDDPKKFDFQNVKDTISNVLPGGWTPWLIGGGILLALIVFGYAAHGARELKSVARGS